MAGQPLRVGVVGVGFGATVHVPAFQSEGWEVRAISSRREDRVQKAAAELGVTDAMTDWRALVARDDLDAVAVSTPPGAHLEIVTAALNAGKHVLCEKPFALSATEAATMAALAKSTGRTAMVAHEFRHAPQRAQIKELLDQGVIGTPQVVSAELFMGRAAPETPPPVAWGSSAAEGGGFLGGLGSHFIDGLRHWFGDVASVSGTLLTLRPERTDRATGQVVMADTDDTFSIMLTFRSGVVATMVGSSAVSPSQGGKITIAGSEGVMVATQRGPNPEPDGVVLHGKAADRAATALEMPERFRPFEDARDPRLVAFRLLLRDFETGIREGRSPSPNFEDGLKCQQVLDAVRESSRTGRRVDIA
ncbi:MAG: Gfo/Idh/MocA family oxidoreductase [Chloroflexi bacterium]|nr:Gfo/Idh/MocA family oxidoreductase [Chloroflexota bacterium]